MSIAAASRSDQVVTILTGRWFRVRGLTEAQRAAVKHHHSVRNARRTQQVRYTGRPDPDEPELIHAWIELEDGDMLIAPGGARDVVGWLKIGGAEVLWLDERPAPPARAPVSYTGGERSYQGEFVSGMLAQDFGMGVGPCGSGKTNTALDLMCRRGQRWLIVVRQHELVRQWAERIAAVTTGSVTIYKPQNKKKWTADADFMIATAQALIKHPDHCYQIDQEREGLCVDECDEVPANEMVALMQLFAPRWRVGFTATPVRPDGLTPLMYWWVGPCLAKIRREDVEEQGHLMRPRLEVLETPWSTASIVSLDGRDVDVKKRLRKLEAEVDDMLHDDVGRLHTIAARVHALWQDGRVVLVPVDSIAYGYWLLDRIRSLGAEAEFVHAKPPKDRVDKVLRDLSSIGITAPDLAVSKKDRLAILNRVASGATRVLIATSLADRGLDLPVLDTVVLATPGGSARRIEQQAGRACRPLAGKPQPLIVYVLDSGVARIETVTSIETGELVRTVKRPFISRLRRSYYSVFKKLADVDPDAIKSILRGENREPNSPPQPVRAA